MMRNLAFRSLVVLLALLLTGTSLQAQTSPEPLVVFIEGRTISTAAINNSGRAGTSQLAAIFRRLGARVLQSTVNRPIPRDADVVVIVRPVRLFRPSFAARLWVHMARGGSLLVAADPEGFRVDSGTISTRIDRSGLTDLLDASYGLLLGNSLMIEPWFTSNTIDDVTTNYSVLRMEDDPHPVTRDLARYEIPVWIWGARHVSVATLTADSWSSPLVYSDTSYAETDPDIFQAVSSEDQTRLTINAGEDLTGHLNVVAISENFRSGGRVLLLGDSEFLLNGYGLARLGDKPQYPGNYLITERAAAWLLRIPESEWPQPPTGYTWLAMDGQADDWPEEASTVIGQSATGIVQARAFMDDAFVYLLVEQASPQASRGTLSLEVGSAGVDSRLTIAAGSTIIRDAANRTLADARVEVGEVTEIRLPRHLLPAQFNGQIAVSVDEAPPLSLPVATVDTVALGDPTIMSDMLVTVVSSSRVSLRGGPGTQFPQRELIDNGTVFRAIGRSTDGEWIQVQNARYRGWIATFLLTSNGEVSYLPIISS